MENEPVAAPAESQPSFDLPRSGTPEYDTWRKDGTLPADKPKPEESASSKEHTDGGEAESPQGKQERTDKESRRKPDAEARIRELTADRKRLEAELAEARTAKPSEEKKPEQQKPQEFPPTRPKPTADGTGPDGQPYAAYEDYIEDLSDWKAEQREAKNQRESAQKAESDKFWARVDESRSRYENFDEVVQPTATAINSDPNISPVIKQMLIESENLPDVLFTIGSDAAEMAQFVKMAKDSPGKAIRYIANVERLVAEELGKAASSSAASRNEQGQFTPAKAAVEKPAKRGPESAPAPPLEVGSRGSGAMDEGERALQAIERGDGRAVSAWMEAENRKDIARRTGR